METVYKVVENDEGTFWFNEKGQYHRLDGPAIEHKNGDRYWCINGLYNRLNGPAWELKNGDRYWYIDGFYHRLDGPACEFANGYKCWYINGKKYTEEEFNTYIQNMNKEKNIKNSYTIQELKQMSIEQITELRNLKNDLGA